jgi:4-hydroxybenzoate polyprenyltransferase
LKLVNTIIYTNIFLSFAAVLLTVSAQIQLGMKPQWQPYLFLIFLATLFEYNWHNWLTTLTKTDVSHSGSYSWFRVYLKWLYFIIFIAFTGIVVAVIPIKSEVLLTIAILGILTFLYSLPVPANKKYFFNLREIPYLKIFVIVSVWTASTVLLPVIQADNEIFNTRVILLFTERFLFIFAIAIQFDIRDMQADREAGLKTIPILINKNNSHVLSYLSLLFCFLITFFHYRVQKDWFIIGAISISILTTYLFIKIKFTENWSRYYYQILDGTLLLHGILVLEFYFLNHP